MTSETGQRVLKLLAERFNIKPTDIVLNIPLAQMLPVDSLELVELIVKIEDEFGVNVAEGINMQKDTLASLIDFIEDRQ